MALFTADNAREMQKRGVEKRRDKREDRELMSNDISDVVREVVVPCESLNDLSKRVKENKHLSHGARIWLDKLGNPKTAYDALQDLYDRVLGKPKQVEHQRVDLTTGGKAFTGFSSVLPVVPNIEEICAVIDAKREAQNKDDDE